MGFITIPMKCFRDRRKTFYQHHSFLCLMLFANEEVLQTINHSHKPGQDANVNGWFLFLS